MTVVHFSGSRSTPDRPDKLLADAGYCSAENLREIAEAKMNARIATGRLKHRERVPDSPNGRIPMPIRDKERMARHLRTKPGRRDYVRRKAMVETTSDR